MAPASSAPQLPVGRRQENLGPRVDPGLQRAPQHRAQRVLPSSDLRVVLEPNRQGGVQVGGCDRIGAGRRERGADGGVERRHHHLRRQPARCGVRDRRYRGIGVPGGAVGGGDHHRVAVGAQQIHARACQRAVGDQGGAADRDDAQDLVDDVTGPAGGGRAERGVADTLHGIEVGLGVRKWCDARPVNQCAQPVQPVHRRGLAGPRMRRGARQLRGAVGGVGDDVAGGHRVDGDQQVRVDGQAHRAADGAVGVDVAAGREFRGGQQNVQPAAGGQ